jgi:nucleoside-diphosphate-sugar epimerase
VLVTGASGFIGGHLFGRFRRMGWSVTGVGRRTLSLPGYVARDLVEPLPEAFGPFDVVVHAAARSSPWGLRSEFERQNVVATRSVIDHCVRHGRPKLVFISSSSVYYGPYHQLGISEETAMPARAVNHYAATKREAEALVMQYPGEWVILRPRAVFGPGDTVLLPRVLHAARSGRLPLLTSRDGEAIGDLIYIDNLVDYIVRSATSDGIRGCFNLTNNEPVPLSAFLLDILRLLDIPAPRRRVSVRKAMLAAGLLELLYAIVSPNKEPPITRFGIHVFAYSKTFDVSKMLAAMGPPRVSLAEGAERTVAWVKGAAPSGPQAS